jgi:hypothetical protein
MTSIGANCPFGRERLRDQYRLIVQLVPSEFVGPFERLRFTLLDSGSWILAPELITDTLITDY